MPKLPLHTSTADPIRRPLFGAGITLALLLLLSTPMAFGASLDWDSVVWNDGDLSNTYMLSNGVEVTITVTNTAPGSFNNSVPAIFTPYEDGAGGSADLFGSDLDLGLIFDPDPGQGMSPVIIEVSFSEPVTEVAFNISDIDFSAAGGGQDSRIDQVVITSDNGDPTLTAVNPGSATFTIAGNTATAIDGSTTMSPSDDGSVRVSFPNEISVATITYNEASGNFNPAGRGIGLLAMFVEVPVELLSFSIE